MLFHSVGFLFIFLPIFILSIALLPKGKIRSFTLLIFSYLFYSGAEPFFILILILSSFTDYTAALCISKSKRQAARKLWLLLSIFVNVGILCLYKYGQWILTGITPIVENLGMHLPSTEFFKNYILPAGISFYTFQSMSYSIDVYRRQIQPEKSLLGFCNYVAYLPQLIAGPIERFGHLYPQIALFNKGETVLHWTTGLDRVALGLIQKLLIADSCGLIVDRLVAPGVPQHFFTSWAIAIGFGMQIYFDFAAYTHIAIGISLMLGIRLQENFLSPYKANNIQDFWRRWHITLSMWFRDYVYIPLGGSRKGTLHTYFNILITFLLVGVWHGAGWNFMTWGVGHGILLIIYRLKQKLLPNWKLHSTAARIITFIAVHFLWITFRVPDLTQAVNIWQGMLGMQGFWPNLVSISDLAFLATVSIGTLTLPNAAERWPGYSGWKESFAISALALFAILNTPEISKFIYFQF